MFFENAMLDAIARGSLLSIFGLAWIIVLVRFVGLRSFSKMTNFDFVMTVAMGSLLAGAAQTSKWSDMVQVVVAMATLFLVQFAISYLRHRSDSVEQTLENTPVLLMKDGVILHDALRQTRVTQSDLLAKLREANAIKMSNVRAVVLETTGDVSVLHGDAVDDVLLDGLR